MKLYDNILTDIDSIYISGLTTELKGLFLYKKFNFAQNFIFYFQFLYYYYIITI